MRVLIATAALRLGSALVALRGREDRLLDHDLRASPQDNQAHCEDAPEGSTCFKAVVYLKATGFRMHPDWYPEYSAESPFQDVQAMLNAAGRSDCPMPCATTADNRRAKGADVEAVEERGDGALKMAQGFRAMKKVESGPASQDETAAGIEAEVLQAIKSGAAARDETAAGIEAEVLQALADEKARREKEDPVHARMAQRFKDTKKTESEPAARDEKAAQIEAEFIEAEFVEAMRDAQAWPEVSTRGDGVRAQLAQSFKVPKKIGSKPAAQDETDADIEAEFVQAMADEKLGPRA